MDTSTITGHHKNAIGHLVLAKWAQEWQYDTLRMAKIITEMLPETTRLSQNLGLLLHTLATPPDNIHMTAIE